MATEALNEGEVPARESGRSDAICNFVICNDSSLRGQPIIFNPDFFVEKLRHEKPEVFTELVVSNITRLIDLPGTELAQLMGEVELKLPGGAGPATGFFRSLMSLKRKEKGVIFGSPLTEEGIAQIYQLIEYLHKNLRVEGLFRIPGNSVRQQILRDALNNGTDIDLESGEFHSNDVATLLKMFLGELPEPLLTHKHFHAHLKIADLMQFDDKGNKTDRPDKERQIEALQLLFLILPPPNRNLLKLLLDLLYQTAKKQDKNKMSAYNLALMFAPHVMWPKNVTANDLQENITKLNSGMAFMIKHSQKLFKEPAPMTEDLLEEQSEVLAKLGTSAEGAHLRARMQSACLLSDMESFKAANPGCCLEDFVRWYSPRDYIEEEVIDEKGNTVLKGELSARMKIPSNMWVEAWETAKPVPARRQRRLFDDTREAEKVLHYLAMQKPADLARHLLPCVIHAAVLKVKEEESLENISSVKKIIKQIISHSSKVLHFPNPEDKKLEEIIHQITNVEALIARARSLKAKFGTEKCEQEEEKEDLERFVSCLLEQPEVLVVGAGRGHAGRIIHKLFVNAQRAAAMAPPEEELKRMGPAEERRQNSVSDFPPPAGRELILRTTVPRPAPYSRALPQRMYSVLTKEDFRLAGAFSSDTSFF